METIKVILVDDHQIVREGIKLLLMGVENIEIIAEASDNNELFQILRADLPDILLLDISLPQISGIDVAKRLAKEYPTISIIMLSSLTDEESVVGSLNAGVRGYLPKNISKQELVIAIRNVFDGGEYLSDSISKVLIRSHFKKEIVGDKYSKKQLDMLSHRETDIIRLLAEGLSYKEIAEKLFLSIRTVESHKRNMMLKLGYSSSIDLIKLAIKNKLVEL